MTGPCIAKVRASAIQQIDSIWGDQAEASVDWLLCDVLGLSRPELQIRGRSLFPDNLESTWKALLERASQGEPIQYILGHTPFRDLDLVCDSRALIPRPETEQLVDWVLAHCAILPSPPTQFLDLATGSGCIALSLAKEIPSASITATDLSADALAQAKENHQRVGASLSVEWIQSDVYESLPPRSFDIIVSNPPYISLVDWQVLPESVRSFEPEEALTDQQNGLDIVARIVRSASAFLQKGGWLYLEIGEKQEEDVCSMLQSGGYENIEFKEDFAGRIRMVRAQAVS